MIWGCQLWRVHPIYVGSTFKLYYDFTLDVKSSKYLGHKVVTKLILYIFVAHKHINLNAKKKKRGACAFRFFEKIRNKFLYFHFQIFNSILDH